eukprot:3344027-Amphidinium_carterae.1
MAQVLQARDSGYYVGEAIPPPLPSLQRWRDRLETLEQQQQEEEEEDRLEQHRQVERKVRQQEAAHLAAVQARRQEAAEKAEKAHQEELDRQAAMTSTPQERVAQEEERALPPLIGEGAQVREQEQVQTVHSSSTGSSTSTSNSRPSQTSSALRRQEEEDEREFWEDIIDIKYTMFNDKIDEAKFLQEGVLYWMTTESIQDLRTRARSGKDPEAEKQFNEYIDDNMKLDLQMREEEEKSRGKIEEREDYQQAQDNKDSEAVEEIVYEYAKGARERKAQWKAEKIKEDNKKKEAWMKEIAEAQGRENTAAASTSATSTERTGERKPTPPRPERQPPIPARHQQTSQQIPATPNQLPEVPGLSPRLRLTTENFKNTPGQKEDSYYEKQLFDEIRQRSYISQHPT